MLESYFSAFSYAIGAVAYFVLALILVTSWKGKLPGALLVSCAIIGVVWCGFAAFHAAFGVMSSTALLITEVIRDALWLVFLYAVLTRGAKNKQALSFLHVASLIVGTAIIGFLIFTSLPVFSKTIVLNGTTQVHLIGFLCFSIIGLILIEHLYRYTPEEKRWSIKLLCIGLGSIFIYDFYLYSESLLYMQSNSATWAVRGLINTFVVPLIAVSAARNPSWSLDVFVSRRFVLHTSTILGAGIYLLLMAGGGYVIKIYGGQWSSIAQIVFLFGAAIMLVLLLFSGQARSSLKVFFSKHLYNYRYDYRDEWLRIINSLSGQQGDVELKTNCVRAIADIVESTGGQLWLSQDGTQQCSFSGHWNMNYFKLPENDAESIIEFIKNTGWVINLYEYIRNKALYKELHLSEAVLTDKSAWLIVPLIHQDKPMGFIVLKSSRTNVDISWEERDLLLTASRQVAGYLSLQLANAALSEARQFEAYNRLSAYLVHDLKNITAQLSLIVNNSKQFKSNPEFVDDMIVTVDNSATKINRLLAQLRKGEMQPKSVKLMNIAEVLASIMTKREVQNPIPTLQVEERHSGDLLVLAEPDRLSDVIEHMVQNAQEATNDDGYVKVNSFAENDQIIIEICDNGCGMDEEFIRTRLFKPFDTTKGNAGMGIGVFETREFVNALGGSIAVESLPGKGTTFRINLNMASSLSESTE